MDRPPIPPLKLPPRLECLQMAEVQAADHLPSPLDTSQSLTDVHHSNGSAATETADFAKPMGQRKRRRSSKPTSVRETRTTPVSISSKTALSPGFAPQPMTGAAAVIDEQRARADEGASEARQTSPNPKRKTLENLLAATNSQMSKLNDAPSSSSTLSKPLAEIAASIDIPSGAESGDLSQTSPQSTASNTTLDRVSTALDMGNGVAVASPGQIDDALGDDDESSRQSHRDAKGEGAYEDETRSNKAFTFPGPMAGQVHRTSSLPQSGYGRYVTSKSSCPRIKSLGIHFPCAPCLKLHFRRAR